MLSSFIANKYVDCTWKVSQNHQTVHSCASLPSCYLCQLSLWVGPLKKNKMHPKNKMLGSDPFYFSDLLDFLFSKGLQPPRSLEAHQRRVVILSFFLLNHNSRGKSLSEAEISQSQGCSSKVGIRSCAKTAECLLPASTNFNCSKVMSLT